MPSPEFIQQMKEKILQEKERVEAKIAKLTAPEKPLDNPQWDETANDAIEDVEQESLLRIYRGLEDKINTALDRIENGTYGTCPECNSDIPEEMLEKEPWADMCSAVCKTKQG